MSNLTPVPFVYRATVMTPASFTKLTDGLMSPDPVNVPLGGVQIGDGELLSAIKALLVDRPDISVEKWPGGGFCTHVAVVVKDESSVQSVMRELRSAGYSPVWWNDLTIRVRP